jgi:hypothetical protein
VELVHCESRVGVAVEQGKFGSPGMGTPAVEAVTIGLVKEHQVKKNKFVCSELQKNCVK